MLVRTGHHHGHEWREARRPRLPRPTGIERVRVEVRKSRRPQFMSVECGAA